MLRRFGAPLLVLALLAGCSGGDDSSVEATDTVAADVADTTIAAEPTDETAVDEEAVDEEAVDEEAVDGEAAPEEGSTEDDPGDFIITYDEPMTDVQRVLDESEQMTASVETMNELLNLPADIVVQFTAKNEDGPYYSPGERTIVMPDSFADYIVSTLAAAYPDATEDQLTEYYVDIQQFVMFHEMGHALVDLLDIPVLGKEEDAVDALAAVLMTQAIEQGDDIALEAAELFQASGDTEEFDEESFWDEHSLDLQRANSIVCWVYGYDPKKNADLADMIPDDRREQCADEYEQKVTAWAQVLDPFIKA